MTISPEDPPYGVRAKCEKQFDLRGMKPVFTYGDTIYNPFNGAVDPLLEAHEVVHTIQQGEHPADWWDRFLSSKSFRFDQELAAYRVQYRVARETIKDRNQLALFLLALSRDLAGPIYGNMCSAQDARILIKAVDNVLT